MLLTLLGCLTMPGTYASYVDEILDSDGDGYVDPDWAEHELAANYAGTDCDDEDPGRDPGAAEVCDGQDQDCDGEVDEGLADYAGWFLDEDGDGYGNPELPVEECPIPADAVQDGTDCDDLRKDVAPWRAEICNVLDDDCDGEVDEGAEELWYRDGDGDGFGDDDLSIESCDPGDGYAAQGGDCDDADSTVSPGEEEVCNDGVDNDCDASTDCRKSGSFDWTGMSAAMGEEADGDFGVQIAVGSYAGEERGVLLVGDTAPGRAYLYDEWPGSATDAFATFQGVDGGDLSVGAELYDLDEDGRDEVILGDDRLDRSVAVFTRPFETTNSLDDAIWYLEGDGGRFGHHVVGLGLDPTGGALAIGAFTAEDGGAVYVHQAATGVVDGESGADFVFVSLEADAEFGRRVRASDVDGDGVDELLIAAPSADRSASSGGAVFLFEQPFAEASTEEDADAIFEGTVEDGAVGWALRAADADGDGADDLLFGAPAPESSGPGCAYVFLNVPSGTRTTDAADAEVCGTATNGSLGVDMLVANLDGSEQRDLVVSDPGGGATLVFYDFDWAGTHTSDDADLVLETPGVQKMPLGALRWGSGGDTLAVGCSKCGEQDEGSLLLLVTEGP